MPTDDAIDHELRREYRDPPADDDAATAPPAVRPEVIADPLGVLQALGALISPALTGDAPLDQFACVLCGPSRPCDCASVEFGSTEYFARLDRAHGRQRGQQ
jgi:hypothetical protein